MDLIALLFTSLVLFSVTTSVAQNTTFKLSDYKNPNYLYQSLDLNFGLDSYLSGYNYDGHQDNKDNSFVLNTRAGAVYNRYVSSPKAQGDLHVYFNAGIGSGKYNSKITYDTYNSENDTKLSNHTERLNLVGLHRFYNQKQNFIEINGELTVSNTGNSGTDKSYLSGTANASQETKVKDFDNSIRGTFLIGKGRIEQVQDARVALYLLDDLTTLNREKRPVSDEDVNDLSQLITRMKYKRFFDDRLRKIAEITAIDSFMQQKGIVSNANATYFTSLNDNWAYANNPIRENGHRLFTGLEASFGYSYHYEYLKSGIPADLIRETTNKDKMAELIMVLGYSYEKPTSRRWQNFANIKGTAGIHQYYQNHISRTDPTPETETNLYTEAAPAIKLTGDCGFGYYPNSRTWLSFRWWLNSSWEKKMEGATKAEKTDLQNNFNINTGPQLYAYYYLSEKLRLSFSYNGQFNFDNYKYTSDIPEGSVDKATRTFWNQSAYAALTYSLF